MAIKVTLDTNALIDYIDDNDRAHWTKQLLRWHDDGLIELGLSYRTLDSDTRRMDKDQQEEMSRVVSDRDLEVLDSNFRFGVTGLGGRNLLGDPTPADFREVVGEDPSDREDDEPLDFVDHDILRDHYREKRDVLLTWDASPKYFDERMRKRYEEELGLVVRTPKQFVMEYSGDLPVGVPRCEAELE